MINHILEMAKMTIKILFRNKLFLFFAVVMMIGATLVLNVSVNKSEKTSGNIVELEDHTNQMAYMEDVEKFQVKVYSRNDRTMDFVKTLEEGGMFQFFVADCKGLSREKIIDSVKYTAMHDKVDAIIVVDQGEFKDAVSLYKAGEDERYQMFENFVNAKLTAFVNKRGEENENSIAKKVLVESIETTEKSSVWDMEVDYHKTSVLGSVLAIYSVAFLFSGIIILGTVITEKENRVYTRVLLSEASQYSYILSKFLVVVAVALIESLIGLVVYGLLVKTDVGLSLLQMFTILFSTGVIFNSLSVGIGVCCGNTLTASIMSFSVWVITALLGGLYFDINNSSDWYKNVATLMPQRWSLKAASLFMNGNNLGYPLILIVSVSYIIVILLIGVLGLKLSNRE